MRASRSADAGLTLLETAFPALAVSRIVAADRRVRDPAYSAHRWWARRPPALMRALLLAAVLPAETSENEFWDLYGQPVPELRGLRVHDPFMGGGTTLIEAARLGATVSGTDVDATAQLLVSHSLSPACGKEVAEAGRDLLAFLRSHFSGLFPDVGGKPLHWFWLPIVTCPSCEESGPLYRSALLARDCKKRGSVVRDHGMTVFDPETFEVHHLESADRKVFTASDRRRVTIDAGTFRSRKFGCPACGRRSSHRELRTAAAPQQLVAVERTPVNGRRKIVSPSPVDLEAIDAARSLLQDPPVPIRIPVVDFDPGRTDPRPLSYGISAVRDLFTPRQLLVLGAAHAWVDSAGLSDHVELAMRLALSNSIATNNRLCSYATDYGRLSALFSVRGYSLPALSVELNPLHTRGGRGTLQQCINRVTRSASRTVRRSSWDTAATNPYTKQFDFPKQEDLGEIECASAAEFDVDLGLDLLVFDPPYYDYIVYDELAELFRAWNPDLVLGGSTLRSRTDGDSASFGVQLADCLRPSISARESGYPIAFTYHSSNPIAWRAIGLALDEAKLRVTALWPVRSDGHMGHHSYPGNCEWDVIVVGRPIDETRSAKYPESTARWDRHFGDLTVSAVDRRNFDEARSMAEQRFGNVLVPGEDSG